MRKNHCWQKKKQIIMCHVFREQKREQCPVIVHFCMLQRELLRRGGEEERKELKSGNVLLCRLSSYISSF